MFPDASRLRRLLHYLSLRPLAHLLSLEDAQIYDPTTADKLTQDSLNKIEHVRKAVYNSKNYNQVGLFEFRVGLIMLEHEWFSEAAESFDKAGKLWSFMPERPNICLANFAKGVAHHRNRRFDLAEAIYSDVQEQIRQIQDEVNVPTLIPQIKKYQDFVKDLKAQLEEAQKTVSRDIFHDLSPRIHPSLQSNSQNLSSPMALQINHEILQANIQRHFSMAELRAVCFGMKIDFNALEGNSMAMKTRELIIYCERNRRLSGLLQELSNRKPAVDWEDDVLQPSPDDVVVEESNSDMAELVNIVEAQFEDMKSPEEGLVFKREDGKVHFRPEEKKSRPSSRPMIIVNIKVANRYDIFSLESQVEFINFVSRVTGIDANHLTILESRDGNTIVTIEMPEDGAKLLEAMLAEKDPVLRNFRIQKVELGNIFEPPTIAEKPLKMTADMISLVKPQKLKRFIALYFTLEELQELCLDLDVAYESLAGEGKREKTSQLVDYCERSKKFTALVNKCHQRRPTAFIKSFLD